MYEYSFLKFYINRLTSVNSDTTVDSDEQSEISNGKQLEERTDGSYREDDGRQSNISGRSCETDCSAAVQHQQGDASKGGCLPRLSIEDSREHWPRGGLENQASERLGRSAAQPGS